MKEDVEYSVVDASGVEILIPQVMDVKQLKPDPTNPNMMSDVQIKALAANIKKNGFIVPVITNKDLLIADGHQRLKAAQSLGMEKVSVIVLDVEEVTRRMIRQILNKLKGVHDPIMDLDDFRFFKDNDCLAEFSELLPGENYDKLLLDNSSVPDNDDEVITVGAYERAKKLTKILVGDVFVLGNHRLVCGDSTKEVDVIKLMNGEKADMVFTDPPYGISIVGGGKSFGKVGGGKIVDAKTYSTMIGDNTTETAKKFYDTCIKVGFENFIIWGGNYFTDFLSPSPCWIVWDKENTGNFSDIEMAWSSSPKSAKLYKWLWNGMSRQGERKIEGKTRMHPTQKPVGLFVNIFKDFEFDSCYDGFGGSGSTLIACEQTNRMCYMMELDPVYCQIIIERWEKLTGKSSVKEE